MSDELELAYWQKGTVQRFGVREGTTRIGRRSRCEVSLKGEGVSKIHAFLEKQKDRLVIEDARSRNGTHVNGERVAIAELRLGDVIQIGLFRLHLVEAGEMPPRTEDDERMRAFAGGGFVLAVLVTASVGLVGLMLLRDLGVATEGAPRERTVVAVQKAEALKRGSSAYIRGELVEAQRFFRVAKSTVSEPMLELIDKRLEDLGHDERLIRWEQRGELLRAALAADPPANLKEHLLVELAEASRQTQKQHRTLMGEGAEDE